MENNTRTKGNGLKVMIAIISCMLLVSLFITTLYSYRYITNSEKLNDALVNSDEITALSEEIAQTYEDVYLTINETKRKCDTAIEYVLLDAENDIYAFEEYANELINLIKEYEKIANIDCSEVYKYCDVQAVVDETLKWRDEQLAQVKQQDFETYDEDYEHHVGLEAFEDETKRLEEALEESEEDFMRDAYGIQEYSLERADSDELFVNINDVINNKLFNDKTAVLEDTVATWQIYVVVCAAITVLLIVALIVVVVKLRKIQKVR